MRVATEAPLEQGMDHTQTYIFIQMCVSVYVCVRAPLGQSAGGWNNNLIFYHFHYSATAGEREGGSGRETKGETGRVGERERRRRCVYFKLVRCVGSTSDIYINNTS